MKYNCNIGLSRNNLLDLLSNKELTPEIIADIISKNNEKLAIDISNLISRNLSHFQP